MSNLNCEKCHGTGIVKEDNGEAHTCWKCLEEGQLGQHSAEVKDAGIKI